MSIYGVDIMPDNVEECIDRLFNIFADYYKKTFKKQIKEDYLEIAKFILSKNILCGDALSMKANDGNPLVFAEWSFVKGSMVQRRDFMYEQLITIQEKKNKQETILGDFVDKPLKTYPLTHYNNLKEGELND